MARIVEFASYGAPEVLRIQGPPTGRNKTATNSRKQAMSKRYLEDFAVGQTFGSRRLRVDKEQIKAFAAEFDPRPFHLDEEVARETIFRGLARAASTRLR